MIICRQCGGESAEDDDFCGSCGVFLEWEGEKVAAPEPEIVDEPGEADRRPTIVARVKTAIGLEEDPEANARADSPITPPPVVETKAKGRTETVPPLPTTAAEGATAAAGGSASTDTTAPPASTRSKPAEPSPPVPPTPAGPPTLETQARPGPPPKPTTTDRAAAHLAKEKPAAVPPGRVSPTAMQPAAPKRPTRPVAPVRRKADLRPGDLVCGDCGEGNDPARRFCRRCGHSLAEAVAVKVSWWRRLWRWLKRPRKKTLEAGDRPSRWSKGTKRKRSGSGVGRGLRRIMMILIPLLVLAGFVGPFKPSVRGVARRVSGPVLDRIRPPQDPVRPTLATASSTAPGHDPLSAIDGVRTTHWSEGAPGDGEGQGLILTFDEPVDINRMGFTLGGSSEPDDFQSHPRPKEVHLVFSDGSTKDITLKDKADFQRIAVKARDVTTVQVQIVSVYRSLQGSSECSFAEIELFGDS